MRPLLLIDVDGPLNPFDAPWFPSGRDQHGYEFHQLTPTGAQTYSVALNRSHGEELRRLAEVFDLVWATTWLDDANRLISPILGLPTDLPVVPLYRLPRHRPARSWKTEQVAGWVGERPFAWFDDEINRATRHWLANEEGLGSHLALRVSAEVGLTQSDFSALASFASDLASG